MSATDEMMAANARHATGPRPDLGARPARGVTIVTCMDARIDVFAELGLALGDSHVIRNAGGVVTDDVIRSLVVSQRKLGTREVVLVHHTDCGQLQYTDDEMAAELAAGGAAPPWRARAFTDPAADVRAGLESVRACPWLPYRNSVRGFVLDVATGLLTEVG